MSYCAFSPSGDDFVPLIEEDMEEFQLPLELPAIKMRASFGTTVNSRVLSAAASSLLLWVFEFKEHINNIQDPFWLSSFGSKTIEDRSIEANQVMLENVLKLFDFPDHVVVLDVLWNIVFAPQHCCY